MPGPTGPDGGSYFGNRYEDYQPSASGGTSKVRVDKDNVLQVAKAFQDEADRMRERVSGYERRLITRPVMGDPVSEDVSNALNGKFVYDDDSYTRRAYAYVDGLKDTAETLVQTARSYGYTDDDIAAVLGAAASSEQADDTSDQLGRLKTGMLGVTD